MPFDCVKDLVANNSFDWTDWSSTLRQRPVLMFHLSEMILFLRPGLDMNSIFDSFKAPQYFEIRNKRTVRDGRSSGRSGLLVGYSC